MGGSSCRWIPNLIPLAHREELIHILRMTGPVLLSRILNYLLPIVVTMFCGRLGNEVMAGYGLACAAINITTASTGCGLVRACDTLVSQIFGGKNLLRVGVILQRGIIILLLFCLPCWGLLINAQTILLCLGQDPEVARIAQLYITAFLPAVPVLFLYKLQVSYLQNQGIILPQVFTAALANVANLVTNYVFLHWLDLGVHGSAAANTFSHIYICVFLFAYIWWKKLHVDTWGGWSVDSLQDWGSYMKLAVPSTLMTCFEWWIYEIGGFFAGMLGEEELAAQHVVIMVAFITYMFPIGIQAAACARVGNALGAGDTAQALLTAKISFALGFSFAVVEGVVLGSTKTVIGYIFTSDQNIVDLISHLMNAYCFLQFFDGVVCVASGIILGAGRQKIAAVANFIGYYCIGLPLVIVLMFVAKLNVLGFWLGLLICVIVQSTFYVIVIFKLNWSRMTEEAVKRAEKKTHVTSLSHAHGHGPDDPTVTDGKSADGYVCVRPEERDGSTETRGEHVLQQKNSGRLSTAQLALRRGLAMFVMVGLLAAGASVRFLVSSPEAPPVVGNNTMSWVNTTDGPVQTFSPGLLPVDEPWS